MMPEQFSFLEPPDVIDSLLILLLPPADMAAQIKSTRSLFVQQHRFTGYLQERLHVTMHHVGDFHGVPDSVIENANDALTAVRAAPFEITFDRVMSFNTGRSHPFVLRAGGNLTHLASLQRQLGEALKKVGLGRHVSPSFTPHITLLYDDRVAPEQSINAVSWIVADFTLVNSRQGKSEHIHLARFPLRG